MPFSSIGHGKYRSPSGRIWTKKQIRLYYATSGFKRKVRAKRKRRVVRRKRTVRRRRR